MSTRLLVAFLVVAAVAAPAGALAQVPPARVGMATTRLGNGYWVTAADGAVFRFGDVGFYGSMGGQPLNRRVVGMAATRSGRGYWLVAADGGVFSFGDAVFHGSLAGRTLNQSVVGMAATPSGGGYWLGAADGGVFAFGDAVFHGSMAGRSLNQPVVGMAPSPSGRGYWLVAGDGGVFSFGDAVFHGSLAGRPLNPPVVGMAPSPSGRGYWLVAGDGGVFSFGDAVFHGSLAGRPLNQSLVGMAATPSGGGYWLVASDGGVFSVGDARFRGAALPPVTASDQLRGCGARERARLTRIQLWPRVGCDGSSVTVRFRGDGDRPEFARFRDADGRRRDVDDALSSLILAPATCVRFFDGPRYRGTQSELFCAGTGTVRVEDLGSFDNRVSSMRVCHSSRRTRCARGDRVAERAPPAPPPDPAPVPGAGPSEPRRVLRYVALGDSYSAGEGVDPYLDGTNTKANSCHRSTRAYPRLFRFNGLEPDLLFFACSGAETPDALDQIRRPVPGVPDVAALKTADLVTITIGGNDVRFSSVLIACYVRSDCRKTIRSNTSRLVRGELPGKLQTTYRAIREAIGPDTVVVVLSYPHLFPKGYIDSRCPALIAFSRREQNSLRAAAEELRDVIKRQAELAGFHFLDATDAFAGHEICAGKHPWINAATDPKLRAGWPPIKVGDSSFHPNTPGQAGYDAALRKFLDNAIAAGAPLTPSGLPRNPAPARG